MTDAKIRTIILRITLLFLAAFFAVAYGKEQLLRAYIEYGLGDCKRIPILCMAPEEEISNFSPDAGYLAELLPYKFKEIKITLPRGFNVVNEKIKRVYYKRKPGKKDGQTIYLLYEKPDFFINLFPVLRKAGIKNDYVFLSRTMSAQTREIHNLTDTLFVIVKTIFTPYLGEQKNVKMFKFSGENRKGFINYNLSPNGNYFDCNIIDNQGNFFKIYIKDKAATLDLSKVITIASTASATP